MQPSIDEEEKVDESATVNEMTAKSWSANMCKGPLVISSASHILTVSSTEPVTYHFAHETLVKYRTRTRRGDRISQSRDTNRVSPAHVTHHDPAE